MKLKAFHNHANTPTYSVCYLTPENDVESSWLKTNADESPSYKKHYGEYRIEHANGHEMAARLRAIGIKVTGEQNHTSDFATSVKSSTRNV